MRLVRENIPAGLKSVGSNLDFVHFDTTSPQDELEALPIVYNKLAQGGVIVLDTFYSTAKEIEKVTLLNTLRERGF